MLAEAWGTELLVSDESMFGSMIEVALPVKHGLSSLEIKDIHDKLLEKYKIQVCVERLFTEVDGVDSCRRQIVFKIISTDV